VTTPFKVQTGRLTEPVTAEDHVRGVITAPITLVEYADYQCPYCANLHPIVQQLLQMRPTVVRLVYRHFPLTNVHPYAEFAAEAAEAAGARGKYWQMHDWLFENQDKLHPMSVRLGAEQLDLPGDAIEKEIRDHVHLDRIQRDFVGGVRSGVNGTPTFFINGVRHEQGYGLPELLLAVDREAGGP
jgi:protein-disulfide isomerase